MLKANFNYNWLCYSGDKEISIEEGLPPDSEKVDLPHFGRLLPKHYFDKRDYEGIFYYEKRFELSADELKGTAIFLRLEGAMIKTRAVFNGHDLGEQISSYFPTSFFLSPHAKEGDNRLILIVDSREDPNIPPFGKVVDYLTFAGIYRPLALEILPLAHIESLFAYGKKSGELFLEQKISNQGSYNLSYRLYDKEKEIAAFKENKVKIDGVIPWDIDNPKLYRLQAELSLEGQIIDSKEIRIGFRDAIWKRDGFFLNGRKIKLLGLNRHQNYPYIGGAGTKSLQRFDADLLKYEAGVNLVRTSHYPQSEDFLARCDEIGLLLISEVPGWQHLGKEEAWRKNFLSMIERMVLKERNHPSLIAYGTRVDESKDDHELYSQAVAIAKRLDPYRATLGVRNFKTSELLEDVYAYNDFSGGDLHHGLDKGRSVKGAKGKPLLISEFAGHMFPTKSFDGNERRVAQTLRHLRALDDMYGDKRLIGAIGWCAFDYNTHEEFGSGDHICYHGVFDIGRVRKDAAYAYLSQTSKVPFIHIVGDALPGDEDESLMKPLYVLSNCERLDLYSDGRFIASFLPDYAHYPHLPRPPFLLDDWIGASFEEKMSKRAAKRTKKLLNEIAAKGAAHLRKRDILRYADLFLLHRLSVDRIVDLYYQYITSWGDTSKRYMIKGYIGGKEVITQGFGVNSEVHLHVEMSQRTLGSEETFDMALVRLEAVDAFSNRLPYMDEIIEVRALGCKIVGPSIFPLVGGTAFFYLRSLPFNETKEMKAGFTVVFRGEEKSYCFDSADDYR